MSTSSDKLTRLHAGKPENVYERGTSRKKLNFF